LGHQELHSNIIRNFFAMNTPDTKNMTLKTAPLWVAAGCVFAGVVMEVGSDGFAGLGFLKLHDNPFAFLGRGEGETGFIPRHPPPPPNRASARTLERVMLENHAIWPE
jgi:hypothetical protein